MENEYFPNEWEKGNIILPNRNGDKQLSNNYGAASLLPISANVFEKIVFHFLFEFLDTSKLLSKSQSGFHPGDSFVHHLFPITHGIYETFDEKS